MLIAAKEKKSTEQIVHCRLQVLGSEVFNLRLCHLGGSERVSILFKTHFQSYLKSEKESITVFCAHVQPVIRGHE